LNFTPESIAYRDSLMTDEDYDTADRIELVLEASERGGMTPSQVGRKVKASTSTTRRILDWMVARQFAHTTGNGAWAHYHAGRA